MRINVHDFSGHPFQVELSRELAARGHQVLHSYSTQYVSGRGRLEVTPQDPPTLRIRGVGCAAPLIKYSPLQRARFEWSYAESWQAALDAEQFDVVVACNVPMFALDRMRRFFARRQQPWVLWHQDLYSLGVGAEFARRAPSGVAGHPRRAIERIEAAQVRDADAVVAITEEMVQQYLRWDLSCEHVHVVPNWAPLADIVPVARDNAWAHEHDLPCEPVRLMYAGTLGRKHNPLLLLQILDKCRDRDVDAILVVVSEGDGIEQLRVAAAGRGDVRFFGFQPADVLSEMLGSADVLIALLEPDAAKFSVPSKVLSYLSAGAAVIALIPRANPSAEDVASTGGFVGQPTSTGAADAAAWLAQALKHPATLAAVGRRARKFALNHFDINDIADRFEPILARACGTKLPMGRDAQWIQKYSPDNSASQRYIS